LYNISNHLARSTTENFRGDAIASYFISVVLRQETYH